MTKRATLGCLAAMAIEVVILYAGIHLLPIYLYNSGPEALGQELAMLTMVVGGGTVGAATAIWRRASPYASVALGLLGILVVLSFAALLPNPNPGAWTSMAAVIVAAVLVGGCATGLVLRRVVAD